MVRNSTMPARDTTATRPRVTPAVPPELLELIAEGMGAAVGGFVAPCGVPVALGAKVAEGWMAAEITPVDPKSIKTLVFIPGTNRPQHVTWPVCLRAHA